MEQSVPLYIVLIGLAVAGVFYLLYKAISRIEKSAGRISASNEKLLSAIARVSGELDAVRISLSAAADALCQEMAATAAAVDKGKEVVLPAAEALRSAVPSLLEAVAKVGHAQLEVQQQMRQDAEQKKKNPFESLSRAK